MFLDKEKLTEQCRKMGAFSSLMALQVLNALSHAASPASITELAEVTGLSASTIHRILQELVETGYARKNEERRYALGFEAMAFGMRMKTSDFLVKAAQDEMRRLNDLSRETVHLISLDNYQGIYIAKLDAQNQVGLRSQIGWNLPLYCTGGGKAILANQTNEWIQTYLMNEPRKRFTDYTYTEAAALTRELDRIREQGYALDNREHHTDIICVAAPVFTAEGKALCSISVSAPDYRFPLEKAVGLSGEVIASAAAVTRKLQES